MDVVEQMRSRILEISDPSNPYTQEDFDKEFAHTMTLSQSHPDSFKLQVSFANKSTNQDPEYATAGSSGFDIRANLENTRVIRVGGIGIIPTGLFFELPENFEIQIRPRSGLAAKNGVTVLNTPGTIDADYRGEIMVILINHGDYDFTINHGDRIAQGIVASVTAKNVIRLTKVTDINTNTERGDGKFGSTGYH